MNIDTKTAILHEYDHKCALHAEFTETVKNLVQDLLKTNNIRVHPITYRVKDRESLKAKLGRLDQLEEKYESLSDITDISGIRIITYFADDVDKVASIIQNEFDIDEEHSIDKRDLLDPDRFGYLSLHYVVKLTPTRLHLSEYRRFSDCNIEIQIRSALQHTWAEIEHDLGYKSKQAIPQQIRRRFSQLAGLLELADDEFSAIRDRLQAYETSVPKQILETPASVSIDKASLWAFVRNSKLVQKIDHALASIAKAKVVEHEEYINGIIEFINYFGFNNIAEIDSSLQKSENVIIFFGKHMLRRARENLSTGISLFYLCYVEIARGKSIQAAKDYLDTVRIGAPGRRDSLAEEVVKLYAEATAKSG